MHLKIIEITDLDIGDRKKKDTLQMMPRFLA